MTPNPASLCAAAKTASLADYLASHDELTGLPNRACFSALLAEALQAARAGAHGLALFVVDVDRLKSINGTLGRATGDVLLREFASRLVAALDGGAAVARLGGDEFVVLLPRDPGAGQLAATARHLLATLSRPVAIQGRPEFNVTASVGAAVFPVDGEDERTLLRNAGVALRRAQEDGLNGSMFYAPGLERQSAERLAFESGLRRALAQARLRLVYQPRIDCHTGLATGCEALLRWEHPELGPLEAAQFLPLAEESGLIVPIGRWVLRTACEQQVRWRVQGLAPLRMAVNLSAREFADAGLLAGLESAIADAGIDPTFLELEVTESVLVRDAGAAQSTLAAIKRLGAGVSVDHFGTGYSSIASLRRFPVDAIKIDRSFVRELPAGEAEQAIAHAIVARGRTLGLTVMAAGVETEAQADFLREHGCDAIQGFHCGRPLPAAAMPAYLEARRHARDRRAPAAAGASGAAAEAASVT